MHIGQSDENAAPSGDAEGVDNDSYSRIDKGAMDDFDDDIPF